MSLPSSWLFFSAILWATLGWADEEPARVMRTVVVDMVERVENPGNIEFVGCSKACHDSLDDAFTLKLTASVPDDRVEVEIDGNWPVTTTLSMRSDLYYFAMVGEMGVDPDERFSSLRTHHGLDDTVNFEVTTIAVNERPGMRAVPGVDDVEGPASTQALEENLPDEERVFVAEAPVVPTQSASLPIRQILSFLGALGIGGVLGLWFNRR